jgi:hypothetical protein
VRAAAGIGKADASILVRRWRQRSATTKMSSERAEHARRKEIEVNIFLKTASLFIF